MPFQSEKQRRYLWANEPEIARDWTDTYGSRIKKDDGGIMNPRLVPHTGADLLVKNTTTGERPKYQPPGGGETSLGSGAAHSGSDRGPRDAPDRHGRTPTKNVHQTGAVSQTPGTQKARAAAAAAAGSKRPGHGDSSLTRPYNYGETKRKALIIDHKAEAEKKERADWKKQQEQQKFKFPSLWGMGIDAAKKFKAWNNVKQRQNFLKQLKVGPGGLGDELGALFEDEDYLLSDAGIAKLNELGYQNYLNRFQQGAGAGGGGGDGQRGGYMGYPSYEAWKAAQGTGATAAVAPQLSEFQQSLTAGANNPFNYYVGTTPGAQNLAWGKQMGVDPRTMGLTSFAADGGRIPAAYGGIMDSSTGRRAYGLGSIFKKVGRAAKKVLKSPIGRGALMAGIGAYGMGMGPFSGMKGAGFLKGALSPGGSPGQKAGWLRNIFSGGKGFENRLNPWKIGLGAATALPFFMGGEEEDEDSKFDYDAAKNAYRDEMMRIKAGSMAGTLDPNKFSYLPTYKEGGRIGLSNGGDPLLREEYNKYVFEMEEMGLTPMSFEEFAAQARAGMYAGGQSTPSDYTMEDALMTTTQDKLGGITDVMKQADLFRQGDVGQFYAADGGRIGYAGGSGKPPITIGQVPQAPQMPAPQAPQRPNPMPAPQPNRMGGMPGGMNPMMGGMHPMMNRPMMNPMMRGRRMAQEGGLMDLGGMEKDYRQEGGFVPLGGEEKADDVPARLSKNEFVFTADAVRGAGGGDIDKGAEIMENIMKNLEEGGQISEETQGLSGAQEMFGVSERLSEVV